MPSRRTRADLTIEDLAELHADAQRCAERAHLTYVEAETSGIHRRRRGKGFSYTDARGRRVTDAATLDRIRELAIPPAWRDVWICGDPDGHLQATGLDDKGRKQYQYHPSWREQRDLINFYRLIVIGRALPALRLYTGRQLRRRTLDRERVIAGMLALLDTSLIRVGNEVYAEENDSIGLCTLGPEHLELGSRSARLVFPAKSGKQAEVIVRDAGLLRLIRELAAVPRDRLFSVDGRPVDSEELNLALAEITGEHVTAKDFRTWGGTTRAFTSLLPHASAEPLPDDLVLAAVDEAADALSNTRAVARAHYVHPHVLTAFSTGTSARLLADSRPGRDRLLSLQERRLAALLETLFAAEFSSNS